MMAQQLPAQRNWSRHARAAALIAAWVSIGIHLAAAAFSPGEKVVTDLAGGGEPTLAAIGQSFENLVEQGVEIEPTPLEEPLPEEVQLPEPGRADAPTPDETQPSAAAETAFASQRATSFASAPVVPFANTPELGAITPVQPKTAQTEPSAEIAAIVPALPADVVEAKPDEPPLPTPPVRPWRSIDQQRAEQAAREAADAEKMRADERRREAQNAQQRRAETQQAQRRAAQQRQIEQQRQTAGQQRANANQNQRRGSTTGSAQGQSAQTRDTRSNTSGAGRAAVSNYPGKVRRDVARTRVRKAGGRGVAYVRFTVTASGGLGSARISRTSGNADVDRAALSHVRRAAPFPKPPAGAQRTFTIPIEFRR
ncbi:MAG: cell envelope integrity protein TolA [Pseudomonadota bacterium]